MKYFTLLVIFFLFATTHLNAKGHRGGHGGGHGHAGHYSIAGHAHGHGGGYHIYGLSDNYPVYGMSVKYIPVEGYIIYNNDTLHGTLTINNTSVSIKPSFTVIDEPGKKFLYADRSLKSIVVADHGQQLFLTRANAHDKTLSRVIHTGKLTIYDDRYSFPAADNIDQAHLKIADNGEARPLTSFITLDTRYALVKSVNKTYGLNLHMDDYTFPNLYNYICRLD